MKSFTTFFSKITLGKSVLLLLTPILTAIISMKAALLGLLILIFIDLITGIRKTHHQRGVTCNPLKAEFWKAIKSYLLRETWRKSYEYGIGIIVVVVLETMVFGTSLTIMLAEKSFTLAELLTVVPSMIEVWSIFENFEAVSGKNVLKRIKFLLPESIRKIFTSKKQE